jgi:hypothetical protein
MKSILIKTTRLMTPIFVPYNVLTPLTPKQKKLLSYENIIQAPSLLQCLMIIIVKLLIFVPSTTF